MGSCFSSSGKPCKKRHAVKGEDYDTASNTSRGQNRNSAGPQQKCSLKPPRNLDFGSSCHTSISSATMASCNLEETQQGLPRTFPKFWALPKELHLMIAAEHIKAHESRTIVIHCATRSQRSANPDQLSGSIDSASTPLSPETAAEATKQFESATPSCLPPTWPWKLKVLTCAIPAALQVNKEFRQEAKRFYKLSFSRQLGGRPQWFDFEKDVLFMASGGAYDLFRYGIRNNQDDQDAREGIERQLRHLALGGLRSSDVVDFCNNAQIFQKLRVFYLETRCPDWSWLVSYWFQQLREDIEAVCNRRAGPEGSNATPEIIALESLELKHRLGLPPETDILAEMGGTQNAPPSPSTHDIQTRRSRDRLKYINSILQMSEREIRKMNDQIRQFNADLDTCNRSSHVVEPTS